jgi:hypothetical protein
VVLTSTGAHHDATNIVMVRGLIGDDDDDDDDDAVGLATKTTRERTPEELP